MCVGRTAAGAANIALDSDKLLKSTKRCKKKRDYESQAKILQAGARQASRAEWSQAKRSRTKSNRAEPSWAATKSLSQSVSRPTVCKRSPVPPLAQSPSPSQIFASNRSFVLFSAWPGPGPAPGLGFGLELGPGYIISALTCQPNSQIAKWSAGMERPT